MRIKLTILILFGFFLLPFAIVSARIGVGVGAGKIHIDKKLKAGGIYDLPIIPVINTGDEPAEYQFSVQYHEGQETRIDMGARPAEGWFDFQPSSFHLEPGKVQTVKVTLTLPTKIKPGNYFAYLEARPVKKSVAGQTAIGIAAATQLWFTVEPANFFQGVYYRLISLHSRYFPWDIVVLVAFLMGTLLWFVMKKFKFQVVKK